jgi:exodeoxyribonuclease V alpha subunit
MILDGKDRLYLRRYWAYESVLAERLVGLSAEVTAFDQDRVRSRIQALFPATGGEAGLDWQKVAVVMALKGRLCIITGGPGTGKTTVVSKILALLLEEDPGLVPGLAAPTGKAAHRLREALDKACLQPGVGEGMPGRIPEP